MKLSEQNRTTLLLHLHKTIEESANNTANDILAGRVNHIIDYPQNGGLNETEKRALNELKGNEEIRNALRKLFASNCASVLFDFFNIIDGTGDPDPRTGNWEEVMIVDMPENFDEHIEFLHDHFYDTYWKWKEKRKANFSLELE